MEWISVKDRLPKKSGSYLVVIKGFDPFSTAFRRDKGWHDQDKGRDALFDPWSHLVTHWRPLPKPPK